MIAKKMVGEYLGPFNEKDNNYKLRQLKDTETHFNIVPGFDDSELIVDVIYKATFFQLEYNAQAQFSHATKYGAIYVPIKDLVEGDLIFYGKDETQINYVAIYIGNGKIIEIDEASLNCTKYYIKESPLRKENLINKAVRFEFKLSSEIGEKIVDLAEAMIGKYPYSWDGGNINGASKGIYQDVEPFCDDREVVGFDCSGLALYAVYQATGITLEHRAQIQYSTAQENGGRYVPVEEKERGDLLFFGVGKNESDVSHVAIYSGFNKMIEAQGHYDNCTGKLVLESPIREKNMLNKVVRFPNKVCDFSNEIETNDCFKRINNNGKKCCFLKTKEIDKMGKCKSFDKDKTIEKIKEEENIQVALCETMYVKTIKFNISLLLGAIFLLL